MVNKKTIFFGVSIIVILLDQLTKYLAITITETVIIIPGLLKISPLTNTGAAFGILQGQNVLLIMVSIIIVGLLTYYYKEFTQTLSSSILASLIMGGALGNLIDRVLRGAVTDFISVSFWPTFNIADSSITIGAVGFLILYFFFEK